MNEAHSRNRLRLISVLMSRERKWCGGFLRRSLARLSRHAARWRCCRHGASATRIWCLRARSADCKHGLVRKLRFGVFPKLGLAFRGGTDEDGPETSARRTGTTTGSVENKNDRAKGRPESTSVLLSLFLVYFHLRGDHFREGGGLL